MLLNLFIRPLAVPFCSICSPRCCCCDDRAPHMLLPTPAANARVEDYGGGDDSTEGRKKRGRARQCAVRRLYRRHPESLATSLTTTAHDVITHDTIGYKYSIQLMYGPKAKS